MDGRLEPGDPFENEMAMCERLGLSRPTVRRAIQEMVDQGLLVRRRGVGTTVANRKVHRRFELSSLYDDLKRAGRSPHTVVIDLEVVRDARAAGALDLDEGSELLSITRLRLVEDQPLALMRNWLPPAYLDIGRGRAGGDRPLRRAPHSGRQAGRGPSEHRRADADTGGAPAPQPARAANRS